MEVPLFDRRLLLKSCTAGAAAVLAYPAAGARARQINDDLIRNLGAPGRNRAASDDEQAAAFDEFVGTWEVVYSDIADDGSLKKAPGQLIVGWVLDGRALQDIWIQQSADPNSPPFKGTTLRFYDTTKKAWRVTWVSPMAQAVTLLEGRRTGNTIVLLGETPKGRLRWSFHDIQPDRFSWTGERSTDGGTTWRLRESHVMRRARSS